MRKVIARSRTSLFLVEMILCLLFFALTCSVCVRLLLVSYQDRHQARSLNQIQELLTDAGELLENWDMDSAESFAAGLEALGFSPVIGETSSRNSKDAGIELFPTQEFTSPGTVSLFFDRKWNSCSTKDIWYRVSFVLCLSDMEKGVFFRVYEPDDEGNKQEHPFYEAGIRFPG